MEPHRPKGQASLFDLGTKRKRTEDEGPARELIIRLRPDVQQAVAGMQPLQPALHPALPQLRGLWGGPKCLHHWGCKPLQERGMCGHSCNSGGVGGSIRCACICTSQLKQQQQQKQQQLKKQAVWVRMHLQGRRGRGRGLETLEISETTTEEEEGGEWLKLGAIKLVTDFDLNQH